MVRYELPEDYWQTFAARTEALTLEDVMAQARRVIKPDNMIWVVVGDRAKITDELAALGFDDIRLVDTDGNPVE